VSAPERRAKYRNQFCFSSDVPIQKKSDAGRSCAADKSLDELVSASPENARKHIELKC